MKHLAKPTSDWGPAKSKQKEAKTITRVHRDSIIPINMTPMLQKVWFDKLALLVSHRFLEINHIRI